MMRQKVIPPTMIAQRTETMAMVLTGIGAVAVEEREVVLLVVVAVAVRLEVGVGAVAEERNEAESESVAAVLSTASVGSTASVEERVGINNALTDNDEEAEEEAVLGREAAGPEVVLTGFAATQTSSVRTRRTRETLIKSRLLRCPGISIWS